MFLGGSNSNALRKYRNDVAGINLCLVIPPTAVMSSVVSWQAVPTSSGSLVSTTTFITYAFSFRVYAVSVRVQVAVSG